MKILIILPYFFPLHYLQDKLTHTETFLIPRGSILVVIEYKILMAPPPHLLYFLIRTERRRVRTKRRKGGLRIKRHSYFSPFNQSIKCKMLQTLE